MKFTTNKCLSVWWTQNTTTNHHQRHNTIQDLKFGIYSLVVWFKYNWIDDQTKHNLHYPIDNNQNTTNASQSQTNQNTTYKIKYNNKRQPLTTTINTRKTVWKTGYSVKNFEI